MYLFASQGLDDMGTFLFVEHDAVELTVDGVILVERARVLRDDVQWPTEGAERSPVDAVAVRSAQDVGPGGMDRGVDHEGCSVEEADRPPVEDLAFMADLDEVGGFDLREGDAERVHPEGGGVDRVAESDVAGHACQEISLDGGGRSE